MGNRLNEIKLLLCFLIICLKVDLSSQYLILNHQSQNELILQALDVELATLEVIEENNKFITSIQISSANRDNLKLQNLQPATVYQTILKKDDEVLSTQYFVTQSQSTGRIKNYFNHEVLPESPGQLAPDGETFSQVEKEIRTLLNNAKKTIDYCVYNTNVTSVTNALIDAHSRGVRVRVITDNSTSNLSFNENLPFEVIVDTDHGLMHNKFIVIDASESLTSYVITGSMNMTLAQMKTDPNHIMVIQDQSLAKAFVMEFEEMWGSSTAIPDKTKSKFGPTKKDNTPHEFLINGIQTQLYFSPSDKTTSRIIQKLKTANHTIDLSLLIFTYSELYFQLVDNLNSGVILKGIIDDNSSNSSTIIEGLNNAGGKIIIDPTSNIFHYKMGIIDADYPNSNPVLITGSHNWTFSAETRNDENTLIFNDAALANLYKRAMYYFWNQWITNTSDEKTVKPFVYFDQQYIYLLQDVGSGYYSIFDINGRVIKGRTELFSNKIDINELNKGIYYLILNTSLNNYKFKFVKL